MKNNKTKKNRGTNRISPNLGFFVAFVIYALSVFVPWVPRSWQPPCNNSWVLVLHDAFVKKLSFGSDVVFTFGPYGFLYFGATPQTYAFTLIGWLLIAVAWVVVVWKIVSILPVPAWARWGAAMFVTALVASVDVVDAQIFCLTAFVSIIWVLLRPTGIWINLLAGTALALASLVKFSWGIAIAPCVFAIVGYWFIHQRRVPLIGPVYLVSLMSLWFLAGQTLEDIPNYIVSSLEITRGYAEAMQFAHPWGMFNVWAFISIAVVLILLPLFTGIRHDWFLALTVAGIFAFLLLIAFKAGFVRHDHHEVVAMAVLTCMALLQYTIMTRTLGRSDARTLGRSEIVVLSAGFFASLLFISSYRLHDRNPSFEGRLSQTLRLEGLFDMGRFLLGRVSAAEHFNRDMAPIREKVPFNLSEGSVDLYPWAGVDALYANNMSVRHRPIFESYSAYTAALAEKNRDFLARPGAPDYLLFAVRALDQRFPTMDDGFSWPEILTLYQIGGFQSDYLVMHRRETPTSYHLDLLQEAKINPDAFLSLPKEGNLWAEIDIPLSTKGKLLKTFYKTAILILVVDMPDGSKHGFRLLPGVSSAGFLISPIVPNNEAFAVFHRRQDDPKLADLRPRGIAISGEQGFLSQYDFERAKIRIYDLKIDE